MKTLGGGGGGGGFFFVLPYEKHFPEHNVSEKLNMLFRTKRESNAQEEPVSFVKVEDNDRLPLTNPENKLTASQVLRLDTAS